MNRLLPLAFALLKFASGYFLTSPQYDLHRDEYLYLNQGRHLAWGYLEVPPLMAAQGWMSMALGGSFFWVKFWPFLWGAATLYLVMRLAQRLGGGWFATALAGTCYLGTAFARLNLLFQPNSFEVFGFLFCLYGLARYVQTERPRFLYWLGLGLGLGLLNKYTTLFFIAALGGALLLTPWRRLLGQRDFWGAAGLALLLWLPNVAWQIRHGVPFLHHMQLLHDTQLVHVEAAAFWKMQLLMCIGAVWVWMPGLLALLQGRALQPYRVVGLVVVFGIGLQALLHGKDYYTLGYYPVLFSFGAWWWEQRLRPFARPSRPSALAWRPVVQVALLSLPLLLMPLMLPFIYSLRPPAAMAALRPRYAPLGLYRWEDGHDHALPQDYADMRGWREMADKTWAAYQSLPDSVRAHTLIKCDNYGQASALNYYNAHRPMPPAQSFNGSFLYWYPVREDWQAVILVDDEPDAELISHFASCRAFGRVEDPYAREKGAVITVGIKPDRAIISRANGEHRAALAEWEGPARPR
ncbi:ArnT family glycosyltransferase [Hymenobacter negativus]|uniref:Glycosyltransferase family 39 protein n=1 Tax=Hymenobacter negativus TaxID=2795026 RepID=A0ABS0Q195_9BACT|nr:glycosyltransferase family 39 protein [Hymenobacter negativus]MBH8556429.1 glycosyltransferase family 39 protein [Hymenobacter negativus]